MLLILKPYNENEFIRNASKDELCHEYKPIPQIAM